MHCLTKKRLGRLLMRNPNREKVSRGAARDSEHSIPGGGIESAVAVLVKDCCSEFTPKSAKLMEVGKD